VSEVFESGRCVEDSVAVACGRSRSLASEEASPGDPRLVAAAIAAFRIVVKGGLIPHARHGGNGVEAVAVAGSKLEGTGLEKEHIGHTHVAFTGFGAGDAPREISGLTLCRAEDDSAGEEPPTRKGNELPVPGGCPRPRFCSLGYIVIFGEDLRKPAWEGSANTQG
jgi:hypothetical protein